jgi:hypothetical protein
MDKQSAAAEPVVLPDVATGPHPTRPAAGQAPADVPAAGQGVLQVALPAVNEAARKVGGFKKLSEVAGQLGETETGQ